MWKIIGKGPLLKFSSSRRCGNHGGDREKEAIERARERQQTERGGGGEGENLKVKCMMIFLGG